MRLFILYLIALFCWPLQAIASPIIAIHPGNNEVKLFMGKGKLLSYHLPVKTIFIADPSIADYTVKSERLLFILPKKLGQTNLIALDESDHIVLNITIQSTVDEYQVYRLLDRVAPGHHVNVQVYNNTLLLTGKVKYPADLDNISNILKAFLKNVDVQNLVTVESPAQVYLKVRVMEVSRSITNKLGVYWNVSYQTNNVSIASSFSPTSGGFNSSGFNGNGFNQGGGGIPGLNINAFIDALTQQGLINILAEPNLTTLSGTQASFLAGGQFPIPVPQSLGVNTIQYQNYGATLAFTPTIINKNLINLAINTTVSSLSSEGATQSQGFNIPGLSTRTANVTLQLHSGESIAIGGLLQKEMHKSINKYPGLAELPILGKLFTSKGYSNNETELVIMVTPYLVNPVNKPLASPMDSYPKIERNIMEVKTIEVKQQQKLAIKPGLLLEK